MTSPLHSFARRGTVIVASLATAALALSVAPPAMAAPTGSISGTMTDVDLEPTDGQVLVFLDGAYESSVANTFAVDGEYLLEDLDPGTYVVLFNDEDNTGFQEYWDDADSTETAERVEITAEDPVVTGIDAVMDGEQVQDYLNNEVEPTITGTAQVGSTLTVNPGTWTPSDADITYSYQWSNDRGDIPGATGQTYTLTAADDGEWMQVAVTASAPGFDDMTGYGHLDEIVTTLVVNAVTDPTISGTPQVGSTLTANPGTWDQPGATFTYEWETYKEGQQHTDFLASGQTYVPTAAIVGQLVWVTVVASAPGVGDGYASSDSVGRVTAAPVVVPPAVATPLTDVDNSHKPKVKGATKVGSTLKAKVSAWVPAGAKVTYKWLANGKPIKKAHKAKLKLIGKLKGKKVSVKVTATSAGSLPVTVVTKVGKIKG
ncbi:hypothetical protein [Nocardioides sp. LHG3406-4]|uniref:hypothetical protein n=1 Tax=Nocardioides sp. LHG3406-4 TaxID=2804575 RepID=UPI003CEBA9E2